MPLQRNKKKQDQPIRSEVNLVNIPVSVLDATGRPIPDLSKEAFQLSEEGVPQRIEVFEKETSVPLDLALMIDTSLSALVELQLEADAASKFIAQVMRPGDRIAVFQFGDKVTQLSSFSGDIAALQFAVRGLEAEAGTSLYDAIFLGADGLRKRPAGRRRVVVLVTDAGETTSSAKFDQARQAAIAAEAMLYTILIRAVKSESGRNTAGEHAIITITDVVGGATYRPDSINDLPAIFERINQELRTQYRLGYYPAPRPPSRSYRKLELQITLPEEQTSIVLPLTIHYRKAYFAP